MDPLDLRCPRCHEGFAMRQSINEPTAFSCGHLDLTVHAPTAVGQTYGVCCPTCLVVLPRLIYDIGSGPEAACSQCEWCWTITGQQMLYPSIDIETIMLMPEWARESQFRRCATCFAPEGHCLSKPEHVYVPIKDTLAAP